VSCDPIYVFTNPWGPLLVNGRSLEGDDGTRPAATVNRWL